MELEKQLEESEINWGLPLPPRIAPIIFSKVPISNLPAFRLVSKSWNSLVLDYAPTSTRKAILFSTRDYYRGFDACFLHPKIQCFDLDTLSFVGSCAITGPLTEYISIYCCCNGILFIENGGIKIGCQSEGIFNPMTHEFFPTPMHDEFFCGFFHGFGFSPNTKQYKLFRVIDKGCDMRVLRFGGNPNEWIPVTLSTPMTLQSHGCYMDGVIYWVGLEKQNEYIIYALDVETEIFESTFVFNVDHRKRGPFLQPFNGTIYAIMFLTRPSRIQVWRMQDKYTWITDFIVYDDLKSFELTKASDDGKIFFETNKDLFWSDKCAEKIEAKNKIKTLIPHNRVFTSLCTPLVDSIHFGCLSNLLVGDD